MKIVVHDYVITAMMSPGGEVGRKTARAAGRARDRAKMNAPVRTGLLRNSITSQLTRQTPTSVTWSIGSTVSYAMIQEKGTGPIHAKRAPYLVFKYKGRWVRTKKTRGVPAVRYLERAINDTTARDFT